MLDSVTFVSQYTSNQRTQAAATTTGRRRCVPRGLGIRPCDFDGKPLYDNYEMHVMITQGIRDRKTLRVNYPMANKKQPAGEVNPATQQIGFYIRSPQQNPRTSRTARSSCTSSEWKSRGSSRFEAHRAADAVRR
jgi:hypothetical protein